MGSDFGNDYSGCIMLLRYGQRTGLPCGHKRCVNPEDGRKAFYCTICMRKVHFKEEVDQFFQGDWDAATAGYNNINHDE